MPESVKFLPQRDLLSFEEIERFVRILAPLGVDRIRLTGGEPLVRSELPTLIEMLKRVNGIDDVALTTNGILLQSQAQALRRAGLDRLNISLDTIDPELFHQVTRRNMLPRVLGGIAAAQAAGFDRIRINAVPIPTISDDQLIQLAKFARAQKLELRFIEFMPLDADQHWEQEHVRTGKALLELIEREIAPLIPVQRLDDSQPATDFRYSDSDVRVGFINSVSQPFCATCNRMRITAEGKFRNCLFSNAEWDLKAPLRFGTDQQVIDVVREAINAKKAGHGTNDLSFDRPDKAMFQIGG